MPEAEVSLRLAIYLLSLDKAESRVAVSIDTQHVTSGGRQICDVAKLLTADGWTLASPKFSCSWRGIWKRQAKEIHISDNSGHCDVAITIDGKNYRAESKGAPKRPPQDKNQVQQAIGQLLVAENVSSDDVLLIALPSTLRNKENWQNRPLMLQNKIRMVFIYPDGSVKPSIAIRDIVSHTE